MASNKFPPRGYQAIQYPLPHHFDYEFDLFADNTTKSHTIIDIIRSFQQTTDPTTIEVNPKKTGFGEETGSVCQMNSIIPKIQMRLSATLTKGAVETDKVRTLRFNWMPIYMSFKEGWQATDENSGLTTETILEIEKVDGSESGRPLFTDVDLGTELHPLSTINNTETFAMLGLLTDAKLEAIDFNELNFWQAKRYFTNKGVINKATGQWHDVILSRDRPYTYFSDNFTHPTVKRINPYTWCGVLFHCPLAGTVSQMVEAGDVTDIPHIRFRISIQYDEWNNLYDQGTI